LNWILQVLVSQVYPRLAIVGELFGFH